VYGRQGLYSQVVRFCYTILSIAYGLGTPVARAADPQPYSVELASTGDRTLDSTLEETSLLSTLRTTAPASPTGLINRARADVERLKTVLESFGYYQSSVAIMIDGAVLEDPGLADRLLGLSNGTDVQCRVIPSLGPLYHLGHIEVEPDLPDEARRALGLSPGAPAVATDVLAGGERLLAALEDLGFAFARLERPIAYEDPTHHVLDVRFRVETGSSMQIGEIRIDGLRDVHEALLRRRLLLRTGETYSATKVERARRSLLDLGVFAAVTVRLRQVAESPDRVAVTFEAQERLQHAIGIGAAYSSDLGGSGGINWTHRNVFGNGEQLTLGAAAINIGGNAATSIGYDFSAKYIIPDVGRRDQSLQIAASALRQALDAYDQTAQSVGITARRKLSNVWSVSIGVSAAYNNVVQQGETRDYTRLASPITVLYDSTNVASPLGDSRSGMRVAGTVTPTLSLGNPNAVFVVLQATIATFIDLHALMRAEAGGSVLALRALAGVAKGAGLFDLPPDQRFYAGGSGTIRGYRYQSVGPQFPDGSPSGGTAINSATVELRERFGASVGAAVFADGGAVSQGSDPWAGTFRVGVGIGLRYYSPLGPIRADIAIPTKRDPGDDRFEVYVGLGQAF
jgi:translocation and assembly module TamA